MERNEHQYLSEFARTHFGKGKAEGEAKGKAEGMAKSIIQVLEIRELTLSEEQRERLLGVRDIAVLETMLTLAMEIDQADALFTPLQAPEA